MGNNSGLGSDWRASRSNRGSTAAPTADLGDPSWRTNPENEAYTEPPATTGAPGWRPSRVNS